MSEVFRMSARGLGLGTTSEALGAEDGDGAALLEALSLKERGVGDIASLAVGELKGMFEKRLTAVISHRAR